MRTLDVVGPDESGAHLLCRDAATGEEFLVPGEQLRVAADTHRERPAGQVRDRQESQESRPVSRPVSPVEPRLRPREIQQRIRLGASLEEVAEVAGCDVARIEKFAYPVLMERSSVADRARLAFPVVNGVPTRETVEQLAERTLAARGQSGRSRWDAYRTEIDGWVLVLAWHAGHTENTARWRFHAGSRGGTVTPLDDAAAGIVDPAPRPLRTVPETVAEPVAPVPVNPLVLQAPTEPGRAVGDPVVELEPGLVPEAQIPAAQSARSARTPQPSRPGAGASPAGRSGNKVAAAMAHHAVPTSTPQQARAEVARTGTDDARPARNGRQAMPSWEDVLLGVRSSGR